MQTKSSYFYLGAILIAGLATLVASHLGSEVAGSHPSKISPPEYPQNFPTSVGRDGELANDLVASALK